LRQYLFGDEEKEMFVRMMRKQAEFCGVDVLAYCMMSNHFHILAWVRHEDEIGDVSY
jgi:putative transposase